MLSKSGSGAGPGWGSAACLALFKDIEVVFKPKLSGDNLTFKLHLKERGADNKAKIELKKSDDGLYRLKIKQPQKYFNNNAGHFVLVIEVIEKKELDFKEAEIKNRWLIDEFSAALNISIKKDKQVRW